MKVKIFKIAAIALTLAVCFSSCGKRKNLELDNCGVVLNKEGLVMDFGSPAVDGCGWLIEVNDSIYAPEDWKLDEKFRIDSLKIYIDYKKISSFRDCNWWTPGQDVYPNHVYPEIKILTIKIR